MFLLIGAHSSIHTTCPGRDPPTWVALPGIKVTRDNVVEAYQSIWHAAAPRSLLSKLLKPKEK